MKNDNKAVTKDIYNKIRFTIIFRILAFSLIILAYILINFKDIIRYSVLIYFFIASAIGITLIYWTILTYIKKKENYRFLVYFGYAQLSADSIFISFVVLFNGGINDKFVFLYYVLILTAGFIFLKAGVMIFGIASAIAIGLSADLQYYFDIGYHSYFLYNPDKLLFITSTNILGVLIFSWLLYHFSGELGTLGDTIVERDEFIKNSQNFNRELFNSFSQGVIVLDEDDSVVFLNDAAINMLNLNSSYADFSHKSGILHKFDIQISDVFENFPVNNLVQESDAKNNLKRFELKYKNMILGFGITKLETSGTKIGRYILLFRDITYIKQLELESKINEGLTTAGKLAGWLAHEIRNPLSAINTSIYVLKTENMDCKEGNYSRLLDIITTEVHKLDNLVSDFLGFVKIKSKTIGGNGNFEKINLFYFLEELISKYAANGIKIHNSVSKELEISSEKSRIGQILANIIQNAVQSIKRKSMSFKNRAPEIGIIRIGSKNIKKSADKNYISISVSDNGEGMDDFTLKNAFKPLFTTKEDGFGLGLSIVYSVTESLGGEADIISRAGKGTLIKINIPI
ncbi:MAG: two-component system sensor histidine kinase NtrB [bacterium]